MISYLPDISFYLSVHTEISQHLTRSLGGKPENLHFILINSKSPVCEKIIQLLLASAQEDLLCGTKLLFLEVEIEKKKKTKRKKTYLFVGGVGGFSGRKSVWVRGCSAGRTTGAGLLIFSGSR